MMLTFMTCLLLVIYSNDCLIIKTIRAPCPSFDQRQKVTKVLRRAGAPHTRRSKSLYALYSRSLRILCCTTATQLHQTKISQHPIQHHRPIRIPIQYGSLRKSKYTKLKINLNNGYFHI